MLHNLAAIIKTHENAIQPLMKKMFLAEWQSATQGNQDTLARLSELRAEWRRYFSQQESYDELSELKAAATNTPVDPVLKRQLDVLFLRFAANQTQPDSIVEMTRIEKEITDKFVNFRARANGKALSDNEITHALSTETDSAALRDIWQAGKQIGKQVAPLIKDVVRIRNAEAQRQGYRNYYAMSLELDEIDEVDLFQTLAELDAMTEKPFRAAKAELDAYLSTRFRVSVENLRPWHYFDPFFQRPPQSTDVNLDTLFEGKDLVELAISTFDRWGMDTRDVIAQSDLYARDGKDQHAFCLDIDRAGDVRILCNLASTTRWAETLLHELGHAVYDKYLPPSLPFFLRQPAHTASTEAIAMLFGRLPLNPDWLKLVAGLDAGRIDSLAPKIHKQLKMSMLTFMRWALVMTHFERAMYADPEQNLDALWWDLVERFQLLTRPEEENRPVAAWASKIHLGLYPVYYQNYVLGELMASQLQAQIEKQCEQLVECVAGGDFLRNELFARGTLANWGTTLEQVTGEPLTPKYFVQQFVA